MSATRDLDVEVDQTTGKVYAWIAGVRVEIATEEECERVSFVVCGPVSYFPDDVHTICAACGAGIVHRPYAPKRPPKICLDCVVQFETKGGGQA